MAAENNEQGKVDIANEVDTTIVKVCNKINGDAVYAEDSYADTVKALAELVRARALLK